MWKDEPPMTTEPLYQIQRDLALRQDGAQGWWGAARPGRAGRRMENLQTPLQHPKGSLLPEAPSNIPSYSKLCPTWPWDISRDPRAAIAALGNLLQFHQQFILYFVFSQTGFSPRKKFVSSSETLVNEPSTTVHDPLSSQWVPEQIWALPIMYFGEVWENETQKRKKACTSSCLLSPCRSIIKKSNQIKTSFMQEHAKTKVAAEEEEVQRRCRRFSKCNSKKASSSYKPPTLNCYAWYKCFHHLASLISSVKMKEKGETKQNKTKHRKLKRCSCGIDKSAN